MNAQSLTIRIRLSITTAIAIFLTTWSLAKGLKTGNWAFLFMPLVIPCLIYLSTHTHQWLALIVGLFYSWIYLPGLSQSFSLFYVMVTACIPVLVVNRSIQPVKHHLSSTIRAASIVYGGIMIITILARGFGLRFFGGCLWGGAAYLQTLVVIVFFVLSDAINPTAKQWRIIMAFFFLSGLIPSAAEMVFILSKGAVSWQYSFIRPEIFSSALNVSIMQGESGILRFQVSKYIGMTFFLLVGLWPYKGKYRPLIRISCVLAFVSAALSGHRIAVLLLLTFIPTILFIRKRKMPVRLLIIYAVGFLGLVIFMNTLGRELPLSAQRAFSWVPFADVSYESLRNATATVEWRFRVWERLFEMIPDYWLIGRGLAFPISDYYALGSMISPDVEWAIIAHKYHSGPLCMLLDLGAPGLLAGTLLLFAGITRGARLSRQQWANSRLKHNYEAMLAVFVIEVVAFFIANGDASRSVVVFLLLLTMMEGMYRTNLIELDKNSTEAPNTPVSKNTTPTVTTNAART